MVSRTAGILLLISVALLGGCGHQATQEEKNASFRRFQSRSINGSSVVDFLDERTSILYIGAEPTTVPVGHDVGINLEPVAKDGRGVGSASPVSADGYFLTAAHCVVGQPLYLISPTSAGPQFAPGRKVWIAPHVISPARIVWSSRANGCEIAIIKADIALASYFSIAASGEVSVGQDVIATGVNGPAGGKITSVGVFYHWAGAPICHVITDDVPTTHGDSGGPLATLSGKLIGYEVWSREGIWGPAQGIAICPDAAWVDRIIAADRAAHPPSATTMLSTQPTTEWK